MMPDDQSSVPPPNVPPRQGITPDGVAALLGLAGTVDRGPWQPPSPEELQSSFPQYEIHGILGRGGMGAVYKGLQRNLDRFVAIKILPSGIDDGGMNFAERFAQEARAMAKFKHPGIVAVHEAGVTPDGLLYFVMECVDGTDVQKLVNSHGRLPPAQALRIIDRVCEALAYAHERGVIHRDIKPSNVMIDSDGSVKVADFGLAKLSAQQSSMLTGTNVTMGTPDFMAPETLQDSAHVDHRADIYAVGVMLYQMLTGKVPRGRFVAPSRAVPGLDKRLDAIVDRTLQAAPEARYSSAIELRTAIAPVLASAVATPIPRPVWKRPVPIAFASIALLATCALVAFRDRGGGGTLRAQVSGDGSLVSPTPPKPESSSSEANHAASLRSHAPADGSVLTAPRPFTVEEWKNIFPNEHEWIRKGITFKDGLLYLKASVGPMASLRTPDAVIRATVLVRSGTQDWILVARRSTNRGYYNLRASPTERELTLNYFRKGDGSGRQILWAASFKADVGDRVEMALRVQGNHLSASVNGKVEFDLDDDALPFPGEWGISSVFGAWFERASIEPLFSHTPKPSKPEVGTQPAPK